MKLSENSIHTLNRRYLRKDLNGKIVETPEQMMERVANICKDPLLKERILNYLLNLDFLPNSPTLMNAGTDLGQLSACFVLPVGDSLIEIFDAIKYTAIIHQSGGGTGYNFSHIRPEGSIVKSTQGVASGVISFMECFNITTGTIKQGGKRRGAMMGILNVDHPEIEKFICCKNKGNTLENFNISVAATDNFMNAVIENKNWDLIWKGKIVKTVKAKYLFDLIVENAYSHADPGLIFIDEINRKSKPEEWMESTNPCLTGDTLIQTVEGEIPIKDLVGKEIDVYCVNKEKYELTISRAYNIRKTKKNASLLKVITTKGSVLCTPDHKFYTRNRGYVPAHYLASKDELVALNKAPKNHKYAKVYITGVDAGVESEHRFIAKHYYGDLTNKDVHHIDGNFLNNKFSNLEVMEHGSHSVISNAGHINWCEQDPATGRFVSKIEKKQQDWNNSLYVHPIGICMKLIAVVPVDYTEDVYDLTVEDHHNCFANHIVVHNCGEQPLLPYESCNLASINLNNMLNEHEGEYYLDFPKISKVIKDMVLFMNDIVDVNHYTLPQIKEATLKTRKIGIGVMGWADALIKMDIVYGSIASLQLAEDLMKFINEECHKASNNLNGNLTTIAPTGTISVIADTSSGIEPIYAVAYKRDLKESMGKDYYEVNKDFVRIAKENGFYSEDLIAKIVKNKGSIKGIDAIPQNIQKLFITAHDIPYCEHIMMQSAFQKHTDSACSKTINMENGISREDIYGAYILAWKLKCKGITIYRDGSKDHQVLVTNKAVEVSTPRPRRKDHVAVVREIATGCGTLYNIISFDTLGILEDFVVNSGNGGCESSQSAEGRFLSSMLRYNIPVDVIIKQARRAKACSSCLQKNNGKNTKIDVKSCSDGIGKHMQDYHSNEDISARLIEVQNLLDATMNKDIKNEDNLVVDANDSKAYHCTNCGSTNVEPGKCKTCKECGISMCL